MHTRLTIDALLRGDAPVAIALQQISPARLLLQDMLWFEALIRPEGVKPIELVKQAERDGRGAALDEVVWEAATRVLALAPRIDRLSVNVTPAALSDPGFADAVRARIEALDVQPGRLVAEISELFQIKDEATVIHNITSLADTGVRIAIDDFGGGQSHLKLLATGRVSILKMDPDLVEGVAQGRYGRGREVLLGLSRFARSLGSEVVAEGVSTPDADELAAAAGVDWVQGYAVHAPEPADHVLGRLHQRAIAHAA